MNGRLFFVTILTCLAGAQLAFAQSPLPIASTVAIVTDEEILTGAVVRYDDTTDTYALSQGMSDAAVYGIVADRPALVFITAATAVPVVTEGVTPILVNMEGGVIRRGDVLTTATEAGRAMRSLGDNDMVFAVALEAMTEPGLVLAQIGVEQAQAVRAQQQAAITAESGIIVSAARAAIATIMVLGAIGFLLYSFRSIMTTGVISIGRNPRARQSVLWVSVGSMMLAIVLTGLVVFVAIGILILPV